MASTLNSIRSFRQQSTAYKNTILDEACSWHQPLSFNILSRDGQIIRIKKIRSIFRPTEMNSKQTESDINTEYDLFYDISGYEFYPNRIHPNPNGYSKKI